MSKFTIHTPETAPEAARALLAKVKSSCGSIPNRLGVPGEGPAALKEGCPLSETRLEALRRFTESPIEKRDHVAGPEVQAFLDAGFSRQEVLEVILGLALKTLSSSTNNLAGTPLDEAFAAEKQDLRKVGWGACQPTTRRAPSFAASFT